MTITLTAAPVGSPSPYVQVDVDSVPATAATLTGWRTAGGREQKVRGLVNVAADGASVLDFEAPIGWDLSYRVQYFDADGAFIGWSDAETVSIAGLAQTYYAWFHSPLDPSVAVRVELRGQTGRSLRRPLDADLMRPAGRSLNIAIINGPRRGLQGVVLDCVTTSAEDEAVLDSLFGGYDETNIPIVCVRADPVTRLPPTLFALVRDPAKLPIDDADMGELLWWDLVGDEVVPPAEALVVALLSYSDFTAFYSAIGGGDYDEFTSAYADYTEASRDYSIADAA